MLFIGLALIAGLLIGLFVGEFKIKSYENCLLYKIDDDTPMRFGVKGGEAVVYIVSANKYMQLKYGRPAK